MSQVQCGVLYFAGTGEMGMPMGLGVWHHLLPPESQILNLLICFVLEPAWLWLWSFLKSKSLEN